jgi:hypothetical protein
MRYCKHIDIIRYLYISVQRLSLLLAMGLVANGFAENHWGNNLEQRIWAPPPETLELDETKPKYMYIYINIKHQLGM